MSGTESNNYISVNVWLAGRSYRIRILPEEEEAVRKAVKIADEKIMELRNHYAGKDDQDFVAMCLLMYATQQAENNPPNPLHQKELEEMLHKINQALGKE